MTKTHNLLLTLLACLLLGSAAWAAGSDAASATETAVEAPALQEAASVTALYGLPVAAVDQLSSADFNAQSCEWCTRPAQCDVYCGGPSACVTNPACGEGRFCFCF